MRVIHLCFRLQAPLEFEATAKPDELTHYFVSRETFAQWNQSMYQPLLALLERNTQKYTKLKFSLWISGVWLDLAEKYDPELIERIKKIIKLGQVELLATPYYQSLTVFYNEIEFVEQLQYFKEQAERRFGVEGRILALPAMVYNDQVGKIAEEQGYAGMLVGRAERALDWRSPNHVYEAIECKYLRLLFQNDPLAQKLIHAEDSLMAEKRLPNSEETKMQLSVQKFQKLLDLECLRGSLINLCLDAAIFKTAREAGIISFFDELFATWLETPGNHFVGAAQACVVETPKLAVSIRETVSERDGSELITPAPPETALAKIEITPPKWLNQGLTGEAEKALYDLRREIFASADPDLQRDFARLTPIEFALSMHPGSLDAWKALLAGLHERAEVAKKAQAEEISRNYTKRHDREEKPKFDDDVANIKINFAPKPKTAKPKTAKPKTVLPKAEPELDDSKELLEELAREVADAKPVAKKPEDEKPKRNIRKKIIRKLVIE